MLVEVPGVEVHAAGRAAEALEIVAGWAPDVVVLDLSLPDRGGLEILPEIKRRRHAPRVIVLTNHSSRHYMRQCSAMGADFFFDKSRDFERVVEIVRLGRM